jgi:integration host factor subunit beta
MTCRDLVERLAKKRRLGKAKAACVVDTILACIEASLRKGERCEIRGLGTFSVRSYRGYRGRDPRTGNSVDVRPKRLPYFKASVTIARSMNERRRVPGSRSADAVQTGPRLSDISPDSTGAYDVAQGA